MNATKIEFHGSTLLGPLSAVVGLLAIFVLYFPSIALAQEPARAAPQTLEELDAQITEIVETSPLLGLQVTLVNKGGAYWAKSYGHEDIKRQRLLTNDAVMRAGSISKTFTGTLAQILSEEGVIDLNMSLREALPDLEFQNDWEDEHPVRLVHLSEHTTGWNDSQASELHNLGRDITPYEALSLNPKSRRSRWQPGRYASYSNTGPVALAAVLVAHSGEDFDTLMSDRIFEPLNMSVSSFRKTDPVKRGLIPSYDSQGHEIPYFHIGYRPSGALNTTAAELSNMVAMLIGRGEFRGRRVLSQEAVERMECSKTSLVGQQEGFAGGFGIGLFATPYGDRLHTGHAGAVDGFVAFSSYLLESETGFVMMLNKDDSSARRRIADLLAGFVAKDLPKPTLPLSEPSVDLAQYEGVYAPFTQRASLNALLDASLNVMRVRTSDGKLIIAPLFGAAETFIPLGNSRFVKDGEILPDRVFIQTDNRHMELVRRGGETSRRVSSLRVYFAPVAIGLFLITGLFGIFAALVWCVLRPFGLFKNTGRWRVWWAPLCAFVSFGMLFGAFVYGSSGSIAHVLPNLGRPSFVSLTIMVASIAIPVFTALGIWNIGRYSNATIFSRITSGASVVGGCLFSILLFRYGWVGLTVWSYTPQLAG